VRTRVLTVLLGLYTLIAVTPALIWSAAALFDRVDDQLRGALGLTAYALPIALGLAAVTLALHGLLTNAAVQDDVAAELDELREAMAQPAMATAGAAGGARTAPAPRGRDDDAADDAGSKTARSGPPKRSKGDRIQRRAKGVARAQLRRRTGF
jgi:hypothetical protein